MKQKTGFGLSSCWWRLLTAGSSLYAQENATITGTVLDPSGAAVPNVTLTLTNPDTSQTRTAQSNSSGLYSFPNLGVGKYNLSVNSTGFQRYVKNGIVVNVCAEPKGRCGFDRRQRKPRSNG